MVLFGITGYYRLLQANTVQKSGPGGGSQSGGEGGRIEGGGGVEGEVTWASLEDYGTLVPRLQLLGCHDSSIDR